VALLVTVLTIGGVVYNLAEQALLETTKQNLKYHAEFRKERILNIFQQQKSWMLKVSNSVGMAGFAGRLVNSYQRLGEESPAYQGNQKRFRKEYQVLLNSQGIDDLFLLTPEGELFFSLRPMDRETGVNLGSEGLYGETILSSLLEKVIAEKRLSVSRYGHIEQTKSLSSGVLMAIPLFPAQLHGEVDEQQVIAILVRPFSLRQLRDLLESYSGLGRSGEVVIAQARDAENIHNGVNFISHFRHPDQTLPDQACQKIRLNSPERFSSMHALRKEDGAGWMLNNSCRPVYGFWTWLPELEWGMVVRQSRDEIMAPIFQLQQNILVATLFILLFLIWMVQRQARFLATPIEQLTQFSEADKIEEYQTGAIQEVNQLTTTLQQMVAVLRFSQRSLEQRVEQRTRELQEQTRETESILSSMQEGLLVVNPRGRITRTNQKFVSLMGSGSESQLLGKPLGELFSAEIDSHDQGASLERLGHQLQQIHDRDHDQFHHILAEAPLPLLVINLDTSALFLVNEELQQLLGSNTPLSTMDELHPLLTTESWETIQYLINETTGGAHCLESTQPCQFTTLSDPVFCNSLCMVTIQCGENHHAILILKTPKIMDTTLLRLTPFGKVFIEGEEPESLFSAERQLLRKNGVKVPVQISGSLLENSSHSPIDGAILVIHDLRSRIAAEQDRAEQANRLAYQEGLAEMSANVLHNIGNAISGMNGRAEIIHNSAKSLLKVETQLQHATSITDLDKLHRGIGKLSQLMGELIRDDLEVSSQAINHGIHHISEILAIQQELAHGGTNIHTTFPLNETLKKLLTMHQDSNRKYQIQVTLQLDEQIGEVTLPKNQFVQVIDNLLKNGRESISQRRKRSAGGGGEILIETLLLNKQEFRLTVRDDGVGIEPSQLTEIFQRGVTSKETGSGIGLHSVSTFVGSLEGTIEAHSEGVNQGAALVITLPLEAVR
jgi:signal transduction histidine kinase/PAS domain-containing protein